MSNPTKILPEKKLGSFCCFLSYGLEYLMNINLLLQNVFISLNYTDISIDLPLQVWTYLHGKNYPCMQIRNDINIYFLI